MHLTGDEDDVEEWFLSFERIGVLNHWTKITSGERLPIYLKEKVLNIWYNMPEDQRYNYDQVKTRILEKFDMSSKASNAVKFYSRNQSKSESVHDYAGDLAKAFRKMSKDNAASEDLLLEKFKDGLIPELKTFMSIADPKSYDDAVLLASKLEKSLVIKEEVGTINHVEENNNNRSRGNYRNNQNYRNRSPYQNNQGNDNNYNRNYKNNNRYDRSQSRGRKPLKCYNCHEYGHKAIDCPENIDNNNNNNSSNNSNQNKNNHQNNTKNNYQYSNNNRRYNNNNNYSNNRNNRSNNNSNQNHNQNQNQNNNFVSQNPPAQQAVNANNQPNKSN